MNYLNLYTLQHENSVYELEKTGRLINREIYLKLHLGDIAEFFLPKYRFFREIAERKVPRPKDAEYAIWCGGSQAGAFQASEKQVLYCLSVPEDQVLWFDGRKWDYVLNSLYLPENEEDNAEFLEELKSRGIQSPYGFVEQVGRLHPDLVRKITASWSRIFDIESWDERFIQASIWEIRKEWVRHVVRYGEDLAEAAGDMPNTFPSPSVRL